MQFESSLKRRQYRFCLCRVVALPRKLENDLTLACYVAPCFGYMAFSLRQMLLPYCAIHYRSLPLSEPETLWNGVSATPPKGERAMTAAAAAGLGALGVGRYFAAPAMRRIHFCFCWKVPADSPTLQSVLAEHGD